MPFAQTNYQEKLGNSNLTLAEAGCFVTGFSNLLEDVGKEVDPPTLDNFFRDNGVFEYDAQDRANDDLYWGAITRYDPTITVSRTAGPGWPQTNFAIVKFQYHSTRLNATVTHFCKVHDANAHLIVDSWDGKVKGAGPGTYYGEPVAFAEYTHNVPTPPPAPAAPAPVAPAQVDGVHEITENVAVTTSVLMVRSAPDTSAPGGQANTTDGNLHQGNTVGVTGWVHGKMIPGTGNDVWLRSVHGHWFWSGGTNFDLNQTKDAPPAPAVIPAPAPPAPAAPAAPANTTYTKLAIAQDLIVNKNTHKWDLGFKDDAHAAPVADLGSGTPFRAFGKAQRTDGDKPAYFMTEEDFGNADQDGTPNSNVGVNTVDLSPPPPVTATTVTTSSTPSGLDNATVTSTTSNGEKVNVRVNTSPDGWKDTYQSFLSPQQFIALANVKCSELDANIPVTPEHPAAQELLNGQTVTVAGSFTKSGVKYYKTAMSVAKGHWYGIPEVSLRKLSDPNDSELDKIIEEASAEVKKIGSIAKAASVDGFVKRIFNRNKK